MSLTVDGVWKAGVWTSTVWADGVWYEPGITPTPPAQTGGGGKRRRKPKYYSDYWPDDPKVPEIFEVVKEPESDDEILLVLARILH